MTAPLSTSSPTPPAPPPSRRVFDSGEKVTIGSTVIGLIVVAVAVLTVPPPDAGETRAAPMMAIVTVSAPPAPRVSIPPVTPSAIPSAIPSPPAPPIDVAAAPAATVAKSLAVTSTVAKPTVGAVTKPAVTKLKSAKPEPKKPANATRVRASQCEQLAAAAQWNDAFDACVKEAAQGKRAAQRRLALLYLEGRGTGRNESQATKWFADAANGGDVESMFQLAVSLERGRGTRKDPSVALGWYTRAGDEGHAAAQYALGQAHEKGRLGVKKDKRKALEWYRLAADQNYSDAEKKVRDLSR